MITKSIKIVETCEEKLSELEKKALNIIEKAEQALTITKLYHTKLQELVLSNNNFHSQEDEIRFFKELKPTVVSKFIYWSSILSLETKKPIGSDKAQRKFYKAALKDLIRFWNQNLEFYQYYRSKNNCLDHVLFVRGKEDVHLLIEPDYFYANPAFCTSHDLKVAKIMAYDILAIYLKSEITKIEGKNSKNGFNVLDTSQLYWTDNKISLVELIYALHCQGTFNRGTADIKELATAFEKLFNVDLGDIYRSYIEIKGRQNPTKFLDDLKTKLNSKIRIEDN
ncbi:MAG: RteC domain-containing protein [Sediminibacterium sp.]|jgi:hypothetical protein|nr:RteC domain-containing protein [Sediminibacterium sp.]